MTGTRPAQKQGPWGIIRPPDLWRVRLAIIPQAGSIVVRGTGDGVRILIVTAQRDRNRWIFPKGHVEEGETRQETALRELLEEAGVLGRILAPAGSLEFTSAAGRVRVHYFLVEFVERPEEGDGRELRWCGFDEAVKRLSYDEARRLLREAKPLIDAHGAEPAVAGRRRSATTAGRNRPGRPRG